jgi:hypothetical protein
MPQGNRPDVGLLYRSPRDPRSVSRKSLKFNNFFHLARILQMFDELRMMCRNSSRMCSCRRGVPFAVTNDLDGECGKCLKRYYVAS